MFVGVWRFSKVRYNLVLEEVVNRVLKSWGMFVMWGDFKLEEKEIG